MKIRIVIDAEVQNGSALIGIDEDVNDLLQEHGVSDARVQLSVDDHVYPVNATYSHQRPRLI